MSYDGDFDGDMQRDLEKAVIEAAVKYTSYSVIDRPSETSEKLYRAANNYLASQNEVGEIEPIKPIILPSGNFVETGYSQAIGNVMAKLNQVISLVNKLARGK